MQKPDVDEIIGLSPAISIDQKSRSNNPRSTVATITEIYDYMRILFARVGKPHCLICDREIHRISKEEILEIVLKQANAEVKGQGSKLKIEGQRLKIEDANDVPAHDFSTAVTQDEKRLFRSPKGVEKVLLSSLAERIEK